MPPREDHTGSDLPQWARKKQVDEPLAEDRLAAFIGPRWERTYRRKFARFLIDPAFVPTWNWSAALAQPFWFLYRKLYLPFVIFFIAPGIIVAIAAGEQKRPTMATMGDPEVIQNTIINFAFWVSTMIAAGGTGNWLLFRRARAAAQLVAMQQLPETESRALLARIGGVHGRATLVVFLVLLLLQVLALLVA